jgi:hypothetical protein
MSSRGAFTLAEIAAKLTMMAGLVEGRKVQLRPLICPPEAYTGSARDQALRRPHTRGERFRVAE